MCAVWSPATGARGMMSQHVRRRARKQFEGTQRRPSCECIWVCVCNRALTVNLGATETLVDVSYWHA
jgi:hypothetical protein